MFIPLALRLHKRTIDHGESVNVRVTSQQRAALQRLADQDGRELSNYIRRVLELHLQKEEARQKREMIRKT